jgi:hypothetical protein
LSALFGWRAEKFFDCRKTGVTVKFPFVGYRSLTALLTFSIFLIILAGCGVKQVSQGIYEGAQTRNQLLRPPAERLEKQAYPAYGDYEHQRTEILKRDTGTVSTIP